MLCKYPVPTLWIQKQVLLKLKEKFTLNNQNTNLLYLFLFNPNKENYFRENAEKKNDFYLRNNPEAVKLSEPEKFEIDKQHLAAAYFEKGIEICNDYSVLHALQEQATSVKIAKERALAGREPMHPTKPMQESQLTETTQATTSFSTMGPT